jgi:tetratricopeptide (TPR) repeat protein
MVNYPDLTYPTGFSNTRPGAPDTLAAELCCLNADKYNIYIQFGVPGVSHEEVVPDGILFKYVGQNKKTEFDPNFYRKHLKLIEKMLEGNPQDAGSVDFCGRWLFTIGVYCDRKGFAEVAWQLFETSLLIDKQNIDLRIRLASALARVKRYTEALKYVHKALEIDSQDPNALKLGQHIVRAIDRQKAVASK